MVAQDIYESKPLLNTACKKNDGLYAKFGQCLASLEHVVPPPFYKKMRKLQDDAKVVEYEKMAAVFKEDMGQSIEDYFEYFCKDPFASASLAQVYRARTKTGKEVAVKIQKPKIRPQMKADMYVHWWILYCLEKIFDLPMMHLVDEVQATFRRELDFRIEA